MKTFCLFLLTVLFTTFGFPGPHISFPDLRYPEKIFVDGNHVYITEFPTVYIYSLPGFRLIKKIGRSGEGPQEFKSQIHLTVQPGYIMVQSIGKVSFFTRDGNAEKEFKSPFIFRVGKAFGDRLVLARGITDNQTKTFYLTVNICPRDFTQLKEIYRVKHFFQDGRPVNAIYLGRGNLGRRMSPLFYPYGNKIFIEADHGETGTIDVFNGNGKKLFSINHNYERLEFTGKHKTEIVDFFTRIKSAVYRILKGRNLILYPDYFPAIRIFHIADNKVYVVPYKKKEGKSEMHIFSTEGKFLEKVLVDLAEENIFEFYPYAISKGKIYQLIENLETDAWELVVKSLDVMDNEKYNAPTSPETPERQEER